MSGRVLVLDLDGTVCVGDGPVNGLVPVTAGELEVDGRRVDGANRRELRRLRTGVGMIFQSFNLVKRTSVLNNVLMGRLHATPTWRSVLGVPRAADRELAFQALERVGIVEKAWTRASELSGGQQQRVAIARVIAQQASVVLADEPVASLDPPTANQVLRDLKRINAHLVAVAHPILDEEGLLIDSRLKTG